MANIMTLYLFLTFICHFLTLYVKGYTWNCQNVTNFYIFWHFCSLYFTFLLIFSYIWHMPIFDKYCQIYQILTFLIEIFSTLYFNDINLSILSEFPIRVDSWHDFCTINRRDSQISYSKVLSPHFLIINRANTWIDTW